MEDAKKDGKQILKDLKYAVFALGSSQYENFCTFGKYCDNAIEALGGQRVAELALGDEQRGQDRAFRHGKFLICIVDCESLSVENRNNTKMESTLFVPSKLTFSQYLRCFNFPLWILLLTKTKQIQESNLF